MNLKQFPKKLDSKTSCLRITVPENLDLALEGLIRKVLREQPKVDDIYSFAANYFETLLKIRDKVGANYTATQLCPFHNDEDAHEMIRIAGTFSKPKTHEEILRTGRKKDPRRLKPQKIVTGKNLVKQSTPDLIKKLPMTTENESKVEDAKPKTIEEKVEIDGEFLTSDPIKELVEKELMLEAKTNGKETSNDVQGLETSKVEPEKENKQVQKKNKEDEEQLKPKEESEENTIKEVNSKKTSTEESNIETKDSEENIEKAEVLQTPTEEVSPDQLESLKKVENPEENQAPTQETQQTELKEEKTEKSPGSSKNTPKEEQTFEEGTDEGNVAPSMEIRTVEPSEATKQKEKIKKPTGGQQPETEINEETKETNENKTKTVAEVLSVGFPVTDLANILNNNNEEKSLKQQSETAKEVLEEENTHDVSQHEEKAAKVEVKETSIESEETKNENEEKPITNTIGRDDEEKIGKNVEEGSKTPKENTTEYRNKTNEEIESIKENENSKQTESPIPEEVKPTETAELKKEKHFPEEKPMESPQAQETDNQEISYQEIEEPEMETQLAVGNEQKPKPAEDAESKEKEAKKLNAQEEDNTESQEPKEVQPEPDQDKKTEPEELCNVVDVQNIQEKAGNGKKEEDTNPEELCAVVDVDNIPKGDATEGIKTEKEKEEETISKKEEEKKDLEVKDNDNIMENEQNEEKEVEGETVAEDNRKVLDKEGEVTTLSKEEINPDELCTVVDIENIPKENAAEGDDKEKTENIENKTNPDKSATVEDVTDKSENYHREEIIPNNEKGTDKEELQAEEIVANLPKDEKTKGNENNTLVDKNNKAEELIESKGNEITSEELCTVVDIKSIPKAPKSGETHVKEDEANPEKISKVDVRNLQDTTNELIVDNKGETIEIQPPDIVEPEGVQNLEAVQPPEEFQIKKIQTHYYDTLQVPETVTKEFIVHNVTAPFDYKKPTGENVGFIENLNVSPLPENQQEHEITDSDDLLDIMTPTSGYSLNLSEISWQTVSEMFLESERRYSSYEKEEVRYTTPMLDNQNKTPQEVEEVIYKTVIPTGVDAVPVPPRDMEEINAEETNSETVKEKKEEKPKDDSEGSADSTNCDNDVPYISVEVKTVIETQILDEEEEKEGKRQHPGVEVTVEATIDIQDDVGIPQSQPDSIEEENKISNEKSQEIKSGPEELQSTGKDEERKESSSTEQTTGKEGSSGESDTTISSAPTEIKRTDSAKRNSRSLLSTQSLDLGKRNPLVKTRSLSTFRHGVTDFEVWSTIEKELEEAATKIQSKFRGYKTRKKLQRENAVQITTEESSRSTTPAEGEVKEEGQQSTGEFHDSIVLAEYPR